MRGSEEHLICNYEPKYIEHWISPDNVPVYSPCQRESFVNFHVTQHNVDNNGQSGNEECGKQYRIHERQIAQSRQITGDNEVEGDEEQQVRTGHIDPLAVILQEEGEPRDQDDQHDGEKDPEKIEIGLSPHVHDQ